MPPLTRARARQSAAMAEFLDDPAQVARANLYEYESDVETVPVTHFRRKLFLAPGCSICLNDLPSSPVSLPCGHLFCAGCVDGLRKHNYTRCPLCNRFFLPSQVQVENNLPTQQ